LRAIFCSWEGPRSSFVDQARRRALCSSTSSLHDGNGSCRLPFLQTAMRGMTGSGDGVHVLTGPIFVETAEPGDVLKVEILKLYPRLNPQGETYGVNVSVTADPQCCFSCSDLVLWTHEHYASFARRGSLHVFGCVCCVTQKVSGRRVVGIPLWHQRRHGRQSQSPRCVHAGSTGTGMLA
jgi:hypothetical protein